MSPYNRLIYIIIVFLFGANQSVLASTPMSEDAVKDVKRTAIETETDQKRLQQAAVLLANYEIEARKLIAMADENNTIGNTINQQAAKLMELSETVIDSARFRLPQCDDYLTLAMALKTRLNEISHEALEKDYHHDGALPKAPLECYHTKDLFVHPATVVVLTRDDPGLSDKTRSSIKAEITEVLAHTELVRQLVIY